MPRSGTAGPYGNSPFRFWETSILFSFSHWTCRPFHTAHSACMVWPSLSSTHACIALLLVHPAPAPLALPAPPTHQAAWQLWGNIPSAWNAFSQLPRINLNINDPKKHYPTPQSNDTHLPQAFFLPVSCSFPPWKEELPSYSLQLRMLICGSPCLFCPFCCLLFSHSVVSDSLIVHGLQRAWLPCASLSPSVCSNPWPLSCWCHPTISSSVPFLILHGARQITEAQLTLVKKRMSEWIGQTALHLLPLARQTPSSTSLLGPKKP